MAMLEQMYFTGSKPLLSPNHSHSTCGGPEDFTSTTIFKKCVVKLARVAEKPHPKNLFGANNQQFNSGYW